MNWNSQWSNPAPTPVVKPSDPRDAMSQDELLMKHKELQEQLSSLKADELSLRKYIVDRAFPVKQEGTNTLELGNGYELKAAVKFNYRLDSDNDKIWNALDKIGKVGNQGAFIADRLITWTPNFLLTEYRTLQESDDPSSKEILKIIGEVLTIIEAAPTLTIKTPKVKK